MDNNWMNRARTCMRANRISQDRLAASLECTRGAISHYLAGRRIPNINQLEAIAACLEVHPSWLLYGVDDGHVHDQGASYRPGVPVTGDTGSGPTDLTQGHLRLAGFAPPCYALRVSGTAFAPRMYEGEAILLDPGLAVQPGDEVVIRFKNSPGIALYNFINSRSGRVTVHPFVNQHQRLVLEHGDLEFMHGIVAVVRANSVEFDED